MFVVSLTKENRKLNVHMKIYIYIYFIPFDAGRENQVELVVSLSRDNGTGSVGWQKWLTLARRVLKSRKLHKQRIQEDYKEPLQGLS